MFSLNTITSFLRKSIFNSHGSIIPFNLFKRFNRNVELIIKFYKFLIFVLISYHFISPIYSIDLSKPIKHQLLIISYSVKSLFILMGFISFLIKGKDMAKFYQSIENNLDSGKKKTLQLTGFLFSCTWLVSTTFHVLICFQSDSSRLRPIVEDILWAVYGIGFITYSVLYFTLICIGIRLRENQVFQEKNDPVIMADFDNLIDLKHKLDELVDFKRDVTEGMAIFPFLWMTHMFYEIEITLVHFTFNRFYPVTLLAENGIVLAYYLFFIFYVEHISFRKIRFSELLDLIPLPNHDPNHAINLYPNQFLFYFKSSLFVKDQFNSIDYQMCHDCKIGLSLLFRIIVSAAYFYCFLSYMYL